MYVSGLQVCEINNVRAFIHVLTHERAAAAPAIAAEDPEETASEDWETEEEEEAEGAGPGAGGAAPA